MKLPRHKTKIVCTIGPASRSEHVLRELITSGMSVARLNLAHGTLEEHREEIQRIRSVAQKIGRDVTILLDLPGPKIRIGKLEKEPLMLKKGENLTLTTQNVLGTPSLIGVNYERLPESVSKGSIIYLNDGFIQLRVQEVRGNEVRCKVIIGGPLLSYKGLNLLRAKNLPEPITEKELDYVNFGLKEGVDVFSVSFVEKAEDILKVKEFAVKREHSINVVAKIEREEAIKNIDEILDVADAIMVARGDLGVQIPIEDVPGVQKRLISKANLLGRPVITATQMLESMTENIRPTRAEVTDVANAILDGTDAVMLSEETAIGSYPAETVKMMAKIATSIECQRNTVRLASDLENYFRMGPGRNNVTVEDVVSLSVIEAINTLDVRIIVTPTDNGSIPCRIARFKSHCWIISFSSNENTHRFLALSYGVYPVLVTKRVDRLDEEVMKSLINFGIVKKGDRVVVTEGISQGECGGTNGLKIITVN